MFLNRLISIALIDLKFIAQSKWKLVVLGLIGVIYFICWKGIIKSIHLPLKSNLLIGERLVGRVSRAIDPEIPLLSPYGYDSQFFWALSVDPLLQNNSIRKSMDNPAYRSQRILLPFLTWCVIHDTANIFYGLFFWNLIGYTIGFLSLFKLCGHFKISAVIPLFMYSINPGMIIALIHPMSDVLATGLFLCGVAQWVQNRKWISCLLFILACLVREYVAVYVFLIAIFTCGTSLSINIKRINPLAVSGIPMILWQIYIRWHQGVWAITQSHRNFDWPFLGTIKFLLKNIQWNYISKDLVGAICLHLACVLIMFKLIKLKKDLLVFLTFASALLLCFSGVAIMESDWAYIRASILFITFTIMVMLIRDSNSNEKAHIILPDILK